MNPGTPPAGGGSSYERGKAASDWLPRLVFWATAVVLLFLSLGEKSLWRSEDRWAEIAREMIQSGDYWHPTLNGEPYTYKPLLGYWWIAWLARLTGNLSEWTVRVPSVLAGLVALWATRDLGRRLWSREVGTIAGWLLLTTYGFLTWARLGEADMENLAASTLAIAWYWRRRNHLGFATWLLFYGICFVGAHCKGLTALVVPVLAILPDILASGRWRSVFCVSHFVAGIIGMGIYLSPFMILSWKGSDVPSADLGSVFQENFQRYFSAFDHVEPFYVYLYYLPELVLPWAPLLIVSVVGAAGSYRSWDDRVQWLLLAGLLIFLFFTASGSRRVYYILPILPLSALLMAIVVRSGRFASWVRLALAMPMTVFLVWALGATLAPGIWLIVKDQAALAPPEGFLWKVSVLGLASVLLIALSRGKPPRLPRVMGLDSYLGLAVGLSVVLVGGTLCWLDAKLEPLRTKKPFSIQLGEMASAVGPERVAFFERTYPEVLFHADLNVPVRVVSGASELGAFLGQDGPDKLLVVSGRQMEIVRPLLPEGVFESPALRETVQPWEEHRMSRKLVVFRVPGNPDR